MKPKMRSVILLFSFMAAAVAVAQVDVTGMVLDKESKDPLGRASVVIKGKDGKLKTFTTTDSKGGFAIKLPSTEGCRLEVTVMGYAKQGFAADSVKFPLTVYMEHGATLLKEVTVKGNRIREQGDTLTYMVNAFAQSQDRSIGDVLKRMPGLDVVDGGVVKYKGKSINKFYIEGKDLLGSDYGIATQGVKHEDVGAVEVMENHQPLLVLGGIAYSDDAAINLKLKEEAKAKWNVNGSLGGGYSTMPEGGLWRADVYAMMMKSDFQHITDFKTNNTGQTLSESGVGALNIRTHESVSVPVPSAASIGGSSMQFNRSAQLSTNTLGTVGNGDLKGQLNYSYNRTSGMANSVTTYFLEGGDRVITENREGVESRNSLLGRFTYQQNLRSAYINNSLSTKFDWKDATLDVTGTLPNSEKGVFRSGFIGNDFKMIKRFNDNHLVTFVSTNEWLKKPESVTINRNGETVGQSVNDAAFYTEESAAYTFALGGITVHLEGGLKGYLRSMDSEARGVNVQQVLGSDSLVNTINTSYIMGFMRPKLEYRLNKVNFILDIPFIYSRYDFDHALANRSDADFSPMMQMVWKPNDKWNLTGLGGFGRSPIDLDMVQRGYIMTNYRTFRRGVDNFYHVWSKNVGADVGYTNILQELFANAMVTKMWGEMPYTMVQQLYGDYVVYGYAPSNSRNNSLMVNGYLSKSLKFMRGMLSINGGWQRSESEIISEGTPILSVSDSWNVNANISTTPVRWLNVEYKVYFGAVNMVMNGTSAGWYGNVQNDLQLTLMPLKKWEWRVNGTHVGSQLTEKKYKNSYLLSTRLKYNYSKSVEVAAELNNILNIRCISSRSYNQLTSYESQNWMRGRELLISIFFMK